MNPEDKLNELIGKVTKGSPSSRVLSDFESDTGELLEIVSMLKSLPLQTPPEPAMRRAYIGMQAKANSWLGLIFSHRHAAFAFGLLLIVTMGSTTVYGAAISVPGQKLFSLKKGAEQLRVKFETNELEKANLQMAITKKRLAEAEKILSSAEKNPERQIAALTELSNQSRSTIEQVEVAAKNNGLQEKNHPVITNFEALNKEQQEFINQIPEKDSTKTAASNALESAKEDESKVAQIKTIVEVVTASKEQTLIALSSDPDSILISGIVSAYYKEKLTVEKNTFVITEETVFKDAAGKILSTTTLSTGLKITIRGQKNNEKLIATEINILSLPEPESVKPEVKGTSTPEEIQNKEINTSTTPASIKHIETEVQENSEQNTARALFIPEDPAPQFAP